VGGHYGSGYDYGWFKGRMGKSPPRGVSVLRESGLQWAKTRIDDERNSKRAGQWCSGSGSGGRSQDVTEGILNPQKEWGVEKNIRLHPNKYLFQGHQIQNGRCQDSSTSIKSGHVVSKFRYKVGLPPYQGKCRTNGLLMFQIQQSGLSLCRYAVRCENGAKNIFKNNAPMYGGSTSSMGCGSSSIYRRHLDWTHEQRISAKSSWRDRRLLEKVRLANKCRKVRFDTAENISVSRMAVEFNRDDSCIGRKESTQSKTVGASVDSICEEGESSFNKDISVSDRQVVSNEVAVPHSQSLPFGIESFKSVCGQKGFLERSSEACGSNTEGFVVVEGQVKEKCANVIGDIQARSRSVDRCLPHGMGSACSVQVSGESGVGDNGTWVLEKQLEFESEGIDGGERGASALSDCGSNKVNQTLVGPFGQFYDSLQHQQESFKLQSSSSYEGVVQLPNPILNDYQSGACERCGERKSRQFVEDEQVGRLQLSSRRASPSITDPGGADIYGPICVKDKSPARSVLFSVEQGQVKCGEGCLQHLVEGERSPSCSSSSSSTFEMSTEDKGRKDTSSSSGPTLVGSGMDTGTEIDDSEDDSDGRVEVIIAPRKIDGKESGQVASRFDSGIFSGRRNDEGQQMVLTLLQKRGLSDVSDWFFRSVAESTWRNYRRGFTLFSVLLKKSGVDPLSIKDVSMAVASLIRAFKMACELKVKLSAIVLMKTAVIKLFSFMFNEDLSHMPMVKMALRYFTLSEMPRKEMLRLQWSVDQLLAYLMKLPPFEVMEFNQLTAVAIVLCMAFTALRFSELYSLDVNETLPDIERNEWRFWIHVKGHDFKEPVVLHKVSDDRLDPINALWTLRSRLYGSLAAKKEEPKGFWYKLVEEDYILLTYDGLRAAAVLILRQAGIRENRPYHIKHAILTCLHESGTSAKDIAAFARHRLESMAAYHHYISYDAGKMSVKNIAESVKRVSHPN
jgi:integrase